MNMIALSADMIPAGSSKLILWEMVEWLEEYFD